MKRLILLGILVLSSLPAGMNLSAARSAEDFAKGPGLPAGTSREGQGPVRSSEGASAIAIQARDTVPPSVACRIDGTCPEAPEDPCLPALYKDWREYGRHGGETAAQRGFSRIAVAIDRSAFQLAIVGIWPDGSSEDLYRSPVALGIYDNRTPAGRFIINHVYCYPDVIFFGSETGPVPGLYNGFFAPLLVCDDRGRCERYQELGLHGFSASALPNAANRVIEAWGAVSAGCIRLPDPCSFKAALVGLVGLGPMKRNERGSYHWLVRPVEVIISGEYPGAPDDTTIASLVEQGLGHLHEGFKGILDMLSR